MKHVLAAALAATLSFVSSTADAATLSVISGSGQRSTLVSFSGPLGQSFTAIDSNLTSFGFQFYALNPNNANAPFTFTLRDGEGLTGSTLLTRSFTLPTSINTRVPAFFDFDITGALVTIGQRYTAVLTTANTRNGIVVGPDINIFTGAELSGDAYAGGRAFFTNTGFTNCTRDVSNCDLNFRVTGNTPMAAVPEPATWAMMLGGFGLAGGALRRRKFRLAPAAL